MFKFILLLCCVCMLHPIPVSAGTEESENHQTTYAVLEEVYPFTKPQELLDSIDEMLDAQLNIVIGIMPIYQHTDYPAMQEFTEVIRYAQSKGCHILLHFPIVQNAKADAQEVTAVIEEALSVYEEAGIYPQGILCGDDESDYQRLIEEITFPVYWVNSEQTQYYSQLGQTYLTLQTDELQEEEYSYRPKEIPESYDFKRNTVENVTVSLEKQNKVLMVIVIIAILIFVGMIIYARRLNKTKFFEEEEKKP